MYNWKCFLSEKAILSCRNISSKVSTIFRGMFGIYPRKFQVILAQCLTFLVMIAKFVCWIFFGTLQRSEVDNILSRAWYTFFDMCLVFAFFQDELNTKFMFLFTIILFVKTFHWLLEERIENYYILLFGLLSTIVRYKAMYMLYADIAVGLFRLSFYLEFAPILWSHHPFPLFMVRPIYLNFRFLRKTVRVSLSSILVIFSKKLFFSTNTSKFQ
ncbi:unnamed protein product [Dibothriocephalus latus]|uniref:E3 ubiquitin-protein ligase synoviolin-like TPR repeats domain-containing protein n=1 Tax=Dibothriocephalus latus TaxID=60516 RepID=A0A3P7N1T4_DIBLA|nr:unnamed protein product [Dibothriocephalus latus]